MKSQEIILIAVAETSVIVRSGLVAVLKRLPDMNIQTIEVTSKEGLQHCMEAHTPNILIVNPQFEGWFDVDAFKEHYPHLETKIVSLICTFVDANQLKGYEESINLFDDVESLEKKISVLMNFAEEDDSGQDTLSQREKEIIGTETASAVGESPPQSRESGHPRTGGAKTTLHHGGRPQRDRHDEEPPSLEGRGAAALVFLP